MKSSLFSNNEKNTGVRILPHIPLKELINSEVCFKRADMHFPRPPNRDHK